MRSKAIKISLCCILAGLLIICSLPGCEAEPAVQPIKIGALLPITGDPTDAVPIERGLRFKLNEVGWEVAGRPIQLIVEDDMADPSTGVDKARKLVESDKVDVIFGPLFSNVSLAVDEYLEPTGVPLITWACTPIEHCRTNTFLNGGTLDIYSYIGAGYAFEELGYRTITEMHSDYVAGERIGEGAIKAFEERGGTCIQRQAIPFNTMDFMPYIAALKEADALFVWLIPGDFIRFAGQYRASGVNMPIFSDGTELAPSIVQETGDLVTGVYVAYDYSPQIDNPANKQFVDAWTKEYGVAPGLIDAWGYITASIYLAAVEATDGDTSHDKIIETLHEIKVETVSGVRSFDTDGVGIGDLYVCKIVRVGNEFQYPVIKVYEQIREAVP